jgi:hypothetical protein
MPGDTEKASDAPLFNYTLASADMRYIEIGERAIYLRTDPEKGPILRGEIPGCGPGCYVDLSQVLLEFPMSCEGCRERDVVEEAVTYFGERLGTLLTSRLIPDGEQQQTVDWLVRVLECVHRSLNVPYTVDRSNVRLQYHLEQCPFCDKEEYAGFTRAMEMARLGFIALCESILQGIAPDWVLEQPSREQLADPLLDVSFTKI